MTQPEALRLADHLEREYYVPAAYELRRLHAENEKKSDAIQKLWKERDKLRDSNEAKADRIDRLGETVEKLKAQRDELLEALKDAHEHIFVAAPVDDKESDRVLQVIKTAIAKAEGKT